MVACATCGCHIHGFTAHCHLPGSRRTYHVPLTCGYLRSTPCNRTTVYGSGYHTLHAVAALDYVLPHTTTCAPVPLYAVCGWFFIHCRISPYLLRFWLPGSTTFAVRFTPVRRARGCTAPRITLPRIYRLLPRYRWLRGFTVTFIISSTGSPRYSLPRYCLRTVGLHTLDYVLVLRFALRSAVTWLVGSRFAVGYPRFPFYALSCLPVRIFTAHATHCWFTFYTVLVGFAHVPTHILRFLRYRLHVCVHLVLCYAFYVYAHTFTCGCTHRFVRVTHTPALRLFTPGLWFRSRCLHTRLRSTVAHAFYVLRLPPLPYTPVLHVVRLLPQFLVLVCRIATFAYALPYRCGSVLRYLHTCHTCRMPCTLLLFAISWLDSRFTLYRVTPVHIRLTFVAVLPCLVATFTFLHFGFTRLGLDFAVVRFTQHVLDTRLTAVVAGYFCGCYTVHLRIWLHTGSCLHAVARSFFTVAVRCIAVCALPTHAVVPRTRFYLVWVTARCPRTRYTRCLRFTPRTVPVHLHAVTYACGLVHACCFTLRVGLRICLTFCRLVTARRCLVGLVLFAVLPYAFYGLPHHGCRTHG